jgi:hypothetical protein
MKKILSLLTALTFVFGLAACSGNNDAAKTEKKDTSKKDTAAAKEMNVKKGLVKFYMELGNTINAKDAALNEYEAAAAKAAEDPSKAPTPELKAQAGEAAAAVATDLKAIQISEVLKDQKADLEGAVQDYAASYQAKADELKKDKPSLDAANATFAQGEEKLGKAFVSVKMGAPSLGKQVN